MIDERRWRQRFKPFGQGFMDKRGQQSSHDSGAGLARGLNPNLLLQLASDDG